MMSRINGWSCKAGGMALALGLALMGVQEARAQTAVVARDPNNPYQKSKFGHVHRVFLYSFELGSHNQSYLQESMKRYAQKYGFQLDIGTTNSYITEATLGLSGDTTNPVNVAVFNDGDGDVLSNATSLAAMKKFVEVKGRGLFQVHAAAAYIPCPTSGAENLTDANCKWLARILVRQYLNHNPDPNYVRIYVDSVKAGEIPPHATAATGGNVAATTDHGKRVPEYKSIFDSLPSNNGVVGGAEPMVWDSLGDEWYNYRGYVRNQGAQTFDAVPFGPVTALFAQDESAPYTAASLHMGDRVQAWARHVGTGLTVYNNMGHGNLYVRTRKVHGATVNDSIVEKINWRIIRYLARDFVGCMDPSKAAYNPEASVTKINEMDNPAPCDVVSAKIIKDGATYNGVKVAGRNIRVALPEKGEYQVLVVDAQGKQYYNGFAAGGAGKTLDIASLGKGQFYVHIVAPNESRNVTGVRLD
ncbi:MAG: hypothetical protein JF616_05160 [Fibrobacteres bacterium]|nr:hypothetical protein [Fibrobacterota bacterium]